MFEIFSHFKKDKLGIMSDIETIIPGLDCSFLLQIILGLSIQLGQWITEKGNIAKKKKK